MINKLKSMYRQHKINKFNELVSEYGSKYGFMNLNDLFQDNSYLKQLLIDNCESDYIYEVDFIIRKDIIEMVLCDYYYYTHPEGAWLFLSSISDNKINVYDNVYYYNRVNEYVIKPYMNIIHSLNNDMIDNYEIHVLMNYR